MSRLSRVATWCVAAMRPARSFSSIGVGNQEYRDELKFEYEGEHSSVFCSWECRNEGDQ
jgi:hypothetical protein